MYKAETCLYFWWWRVY